MSRRRELVLHPAARQDLLEIWMLVDRNDGWQRADGVIGRIEAFVRSLQDFAEIGRKHDDKMVGLRSVGIPGLKRATVLFRAKGDTVIVVRVAYLGRDALSALPEG